MASVRIDEIVLRVVEGPCASAIDRLEEDSGFRSEDSSGLPQEDAGPDESSDDGGSVAHWDVA
jgi:hypothetical protein